VGTQKLNLLLVEDNFEDQQAIRDALAEIEECGPRYDWFSSELVAVDYLADAIHCLDRARFDAVLLDLKLPDSPVLLNTFGQVQLASPGTPVIGLIEAQDEPLVHRLLREGAQDVLVKPEIECAPLARSLRYAIERQRRARALRSISFFDELSGFYSVGGSSHWRATTSPRRVRPVRRLLWLFWRSRDFRRSWRIATFCCSTFRSFSRTPSPMRR
jgi:CheY-like chemotaxis protein